MTNPDDWTMFDGNDATGFRTAEPLPYTGGNEEEEATVNITPEEIEELKMIMVILDSTKYSFGFLLGLVIINLCFNGNVIGCRTTWCI